MNGSLIRSLGILLLAISLFGCGEAPPARFHLNMVRMEEAGVTSKQQQEIADILTALFGTPDTPHAPSEAGLDLPLLTLAAGPVQQDMPQGGTGLFRRHCAHCHGVTGDGAGPTAAFLNPYPRDYRKGVFKFTSTSGTNTPPTREDLERVLLNGIPGTSMPSFRLLEPREIDALVEYIVYLSMRGQTEEALIEFAVNEVDLDDDGEPLPIPTDRETLIDEIFLGFEVPQSWQDAPEQIIHPDADTREDAGEPTAIARGRELFYAEGGCVKCHGPSGQGDGVLNDFDIWNKAVNEFALANPHIDPESLGALPPRNIVPRNLRKGVYRGGRRPLDIYRRIYNGIKGVPMPAASSELKPNQLWDIVDYVFHLPFEITSHRSDQHSPENLSPIAGR